MPKNHWPKALGLLCDLLSKCSPEVRPGQVCGQWGRLHKQMTDSWIDRHKHIYVCLKIILDVQRSCKDRIPLYPSPSYPNYYPIIRVSMEKYYYLKYRFYSDAVSYYTNVLLSQNPNQFSVCLLLHELYSFEEHNQVFCRMAFNLDFYDIFSWLDEGYGCGGRLKHKGGALIITS